MEQQSTMMKTTDYLVGSMAPQVGVRVKRARNLNVEVLRLVAIVGIAVFHTFQPWFNTVAYGIDSGVTATGLESSAWALFFLGVINLLGATGNHIFFMISGYFLLPHMAEESTHRRYWRAQYLSVARKLGVIAVSVAFYAALALAIDAWFVDIPGVSLTHFGWLVGGLEFVWVYAALLLGAPVAGWLQKHLPGWPALLVVLFLAVTAANLYVAFFNQGSVTRSLFEWRKLLSAVTYLVGFLLAGFVAQYWDHFRRVGLSLLVGGIFLVVVPVGALAAGRDAELIGAMSFKSTSLLSLLLALGALIATMMHTGVEVLPADRGRWERVVRAGAAGILGFYIMQSVFGSLVNTWIHSLLDPVLRLWGSETSVSGGGVFLFLVTGCVVSCVLGVAMVGFDWLTRRPLLRSVRLQ